jgi:hypothetical protein
MRVSSAAFVRPGEERKERVAAIQSPGTLREDPQGLRSWGRESAVGDRDSFAAEKIPVLGSRDEREGWPAYPAPKLKPPGERPPDRFTPFPLRFFQEGDLP